MFNPLLALARWLQDTSLRLDLSQSTWGVPIIGAIHVLAIAWFGGFEFGLVYLKAECLASDRLVR